MHFFLVLKALFWNIDKMQKSRNFLKEYINWNCKSNTFMSIKFNRPLCVEYAVANFWFEFAAHAIEWFRAQCASDIHSTSYKFLYINLFTLYKYVSGIHLRGTGQIDTFWSRRNRKRTNVHHERYTILKLSSEIIYIWLIVITLVLDEFNEEDRSNRKLVLLTPAGSIVPPHELNNIVNQFKGCCCWTLKLMFTDSVQPSNGLALVWLLFANLNRKMFLKFVSFNYSA